MDSTVTQVFLQPALDALAELTGKCARAVAVRETTTQVAPGQLNALVAVVGRASGLVLVSASQKTVAGLTAAALDTQEPLPAALLSSTISELVNITASGGAVRLSESGLDCTVTVPQSLRKGEAFVGAPVRFTCVHLDTEAGPLELLIQVEESRGLQVAATAGYGAVAHGPLTLVDIISRQDVRSFLQPLINLATASVAGYEALLRGPAGTPLERPDLLFRTAQEVGLLHVLERLARKSGLAALDRFPDPNARLFLNVDARVPLLDLGCPVGEALDAGRLDPRRLVIEVTELTVLSRSPDFLHALERFRALGGAVALDDVGAGYSGLQSLLAVRPDYIKLDRDLIRSLETDPWQQALVEGFLRFAHRVGAEVVAEGIETQAELDMVRRLGVRYAQGFFLGRPSLSPTSSLPPPAAK